MSPWRPNQKRAAQESAPWLCVGLGYSPTVTCLWSEETLGCAQNGLSFFRHVSLALQVQDLSGVQATVRSVVKQIRGLGVH